MICACMKNIFDGLSEVGSVELYRPLVDFCRVYVENSYRNSTAAVSPMGTPPGLIACANRKSGNAGKKIWGIRRRI